MKFFRWLWRWLHPWYCQHHYLVFHTFQDTSNPEFTGHGFQSVCFRRHPTTDARVLDLVQLLERITREKYRRPIKVVLTGWQFLHTERHWHARTPH